MKTYFKTLFEHEYWANLKVLETILGISDPNQRAIGILSHIIAAQRIWLDRINGTTSEVEVWEIFDPRIMLERLEINYTDCTLVIENQDLEQLITYQNSKGQHFTDTITQILTHLSLHASYHRGQVVLLLKNQTNTLPSTDYIFYFR